MFNKKGMSPLIATILLIALAVSIGATIMSVGGIYYENFKVDKSSCSRSLVTFFELKKNTACQDYELSSILNFYRSDDTVGNLKCYDQVGTGKGDFCIESETLFDKTWTLVADTIR